MKLMNLFSMFDPSNTPMKMAWMSLLLPILLMAIQSKNKSKQSSMNNKMINSIKKEFTAASANNPSKLQNKTIMAMFITLSILNTSAMTSSSFASTAQISVNLSMALTAWLSINIWASIKKTKSMMAHMVPMGSPMALIPALILIELTSNIIRPITLSIRLTANMVAGHVLIALTESFADSLYQSTMALTALSILNILEVAVAMIQAYVFTILVTLYSSENH